MLCPGEPGELKSTDCEMFWKNLTSSCDLKDDLPTLDHEISQTEHQP